MSKVFKKVAPIALPIIGSLVAPGIGTALGSSLSAGTLGTIGGALGGAAGGAASGGGLKGALTGAAGGALMGGAGSIAGAAGLGTAGTAALKGALQGAGAGLTTGSPKNAVLGAALGGIGGYALSGGGVPGLGTLGKSGTVLEGGIPVPGIKPSGVLGSLGKTASSLGLSGTGGGASSMNIGKIGSGLYSAYSTNKTNDEIQKQLMAAQGQAQGVLQPYNQAGTDAVKQLQASLTGGFNPGDLTQDPGYQFQLAEGQKALQQSLAAQGLGQSGAAVKAAMQYGQGLADQTYGDAYNRWLQQNSQLAGLGGIGLNAAGGVSDTYANMGNIGAAMNSANQQSMNEILASLFSGYNPYGAFA